MTDPRTYLADVLAKADAVDEFQGAWEWRESTPGLGNIYHSQNGLPGEYNLPGCGRCGASDQVFESFVGEFIASARTTSPAMARALIAVLDDCEWYVRVHGNDPDESTFVDGMVRRSRKTIDIITTELAKEIEHG